MKRAALVLATSVALLLSGAAYSATRVPVTIPSKAVTLDGTPSGNNAVGHPTWSGPSFNQEHKTGGTLGGTAGRIGVTITPRVSVNPANIAKKAVSLMKGGGVPIVVGTEAVKWAIDQIPTAIIEDDEPRKQVSAGEPPPAVDTTNGTFYWRANVTGAPPATGALKACKAHNTNASYIQLSTDIRARCYMYNGQYLFDVNRFGTTCPVGYSYDNVKGECYSAGSTVPFSDGDWDTLEDTLRQVANSDWTRDLLKKSCEGSISPDKCVDSLIDLMPINGPSYQNGPVKSQTSSKTNPDGTTSTTNVTVQNRYDYKYGNNYFDYKVTTTTTTTKDGQTTTETTTDDTPEDQEPDLEDPSEDQQEEDMPEISDAYKPYIDKLNDIKTEVSAPPAVVSPIGWSAWYSFGGGCSEITAELPVIGSWSTNYCPYIYDWVRPILAFMFVVFTWHYCRELWSEAVTQARPM